MVNLRSLVQRHDSTGDSLMAETPDDQQAQRIEKYRQLTTAQSAIHDSITWAKKGLNRHPSPEERRALDEHILDFAEKNAILEARILAVRNNQGNVTVPMPTSAQISTIGSLSAEVEGLTNDNLTAAAAISLATKAMTLAGELVV
jgi:hypothetical protein